MKVAESAYVSKEACLIGNVTVGDESSIWPFAVLRGDAVSITVGARTNIQEHVVLHGDAVHPVTVGDEVTVGHSAIVHGCTVEDRCLVGMGAILMNGCHIGKECLIAAGSLVTERTQIPAGSLVMGNPAKVRRPLTQEEKDSLALSCQKYLALADLRRKAEQEG